MTLVALRMATAGEHHTTASTVRQFTECLAAYFNGWEESSRDMSWEIIYVQQADSTPMSDWRRCDVVNSNNVSDESREIWRSGGKRCASTKCQYRTETLEETKHSELYNNNNNNNNRKID
ncbi:retrotransposon hot spot (RHS) protein [Trypanosoma cruzi]|nr:retrotransposon hot spot (RHS) protein [Trypanosoma cruzi]